MYETLNILHDSRLIQRYDNLMYQLNTHKIPYKIWDAVECKENVVKSINLSHKQIVQYAKDNGLKEICIGEDDIIFTSDNAWKYFLDNKPESFDLYLAATFCPPNSGLVCGFHLYVISEKFYDKFLSTPDDVHIDTYMDELKGDYHFCHPYPALQRGGEWSTNNRAVVNYSSLINEEDIYRG